jgi:hypothetical protein
MKNGPAIPGWAVGVVIGVFVIGLVVFGYKYVMGPGPLDPSTLPKSQQGNPYLNSDFGRKLVESRGGGRPVNPHQ